MIESSDFLMDHLEKFLGPVTRRWRGKQGHEMPFEVLVFEDRPHRDEQFLNTFGLYSHSLRIAGNTDGATRLELSICAYSTIDSKALGALLFAIGTDALKRHSTPGVHGVLSGSGPVLFGGNPVFQHLYLTYPGYLPAAFEVCNTAPQAVTIVQVVPVSSFERDLIVEQGWRKFENLVVAQNIDLLLFDRRNEVTDQ